ncbi:hypothetical protein JGS22_002810 [Streptomyces sp. P38-E01]|uniref:Uncharacterized protein n=1 Tax=Streptomyces tardus TaxID=2780544 RepID=A0A949JDS2_9ACTN|nr:hypothetical protein [Streptomyces tardus]MBU7596594.1 hypothetical protein [Streptomyces tardus]
MKSIEEKLGYTPELRSTYTETSKVDEMSSQILEWTKLTGKTTEGPAAVSPCYESEKSKEEYYVVRHRWSIYQLTAGSFSEGMENLRRELPKNHWKITRDGPVDSISKQPQILAEHTRSNHTLVIEWHWKEPDPKDELIYVAVDSRCMKVPEGEEV